MKKFLLFAVLSTLSVMSAAATLVVQWVDPTPTGPAYVAGYSAEYRVNGGAATAISGLTTPSINATITAVAGNAVEVRYRASNNIVPASPINGNWSSWYPATQASAPHDQNAPTFILFAY
jgi:hypothetical protein